MLVLPRDRRRAPRRPAPRSAAGRRRGPTCSRSCRGTRPTTRSRSSPAGRRRDASRGDRRPHLGRASCSISSARCRDATFVARVRGRRRRSGWSRTPTRSRRSRAAAQAVDAIAAEMRDAAVRGPHRARRAPRARRAHARARARARRTSRSSPPASTRRARTTSRRPTRVDRRRRHRAVRLRRHDARLLLRHHADVPRRRAAGRGRATSTRCSSRRRRRACAPRPSARRARRSTPRPGA